MKHLRTNSTPNLLVSKDAKPIEPTNRWYRVQLNTVVREGKDLDSERIRILPMGTRVRVLEIFRRRVRIDKPVKGWCSMKSARGDVILKPMDVDEEDLSTPRFGSNASSRAELLREKIAKVKEQQRKAEARIRKASECPEVRALTEKHSNLTKILRNKSRESKDLPTSPAAMKAKLMHTRSCMSMLELENSEKQSELADLQNQLGDIRAQLSTVCRKQGVDNPLELSTQIEKMEHDKVVAHEKIREYQQVTKRYEQELTSMKQKMTTLLKREPMGYKDSYSVQNVEVHQGDVVLMKDKIGIVIVHYVGHVHWNVAEIYVGVELSEPVGDSDGTVDGHTYFTVSSKRGAFFPLTAVDRKIPAAALLKQLQKQVALNDQLINSKE